MRGRKRKRREECRTVRLTRGARMRFRGTRMGTEVDGRRKRRGGARDTTSGVTVSGRGQDRMKRRWGGRLWGSRSVTAERGRGDHIFASARAHVAVHYDKKNGMRKVPVRSWQMAPVRS
eukprot:1241894-Prymnesium_polylepis.1